MSAEFESRPSDWSVVHDLFERSGCGGTVECDDPPTMSAYVYEDASAEAAIAALSQELMAAGARSVSVEPVPEEDWAENWKQYFKPREIGERVLVVPTWEAEVLINDQDRIVVVLDPGQAFGTGDHPTTRLAIRAVERCVQSGDTMLDVGTGSGILSVVAAKFGARVIATEVDSQASEVARENFGRNEVSVDLRVTDTVPPELVQLDVVMSNIFTAVLIRLAAAVAGALKSGGVWITTGVIPDNFPDLQQCAQLNGFELIEREDEEGWVLAVFKKR